MTDRGDRRLGESLGVGVPLLGEERLDRHPAAVAVRDGVEMVLDLLEESAFLHDLDDELPRLEAIEAVELVPDAFAQRRRLDAFDEVGVARDVDGGVRTEHVDHAKPVALADLEVVEVVRRRDLHGAGAGLGVGVFVGDDSDLPADDGQDRIPADEVLVTLVVRVDGDAGVAEHGLGTGGGDDDEAAFLAFDRVLEMIELARGLDLLDLKVRDRGAELRVPVDQPLVLVDQAGPVEFDEDLGDRPRQPLVHGEALAAPVAGGAETLELVDDLAAGFGLPGPHLLDEGLAADGVPVWLLTLHHLALDHHLGGDAGMVHARLPQHVAAAHPLEAGEHVLERVVEGVADMQRAGDVGRRDHDRERLRAGHGAGPGLEGAGLVPQGCDPPLDVRRVKGLLEHHRHHVRKARPLVNPKGIAVSTGAARWCLRRGMLRSAQAYDATRPG